MDVATPHYLLYSEISRASGVGYWRFVIRLADGSEQYQAADVEPGLQGDRLELLTVIRALESLDQPSQVTVMGCSEYVRNGMQYGLPEWQANGWQWEFFGQMTPVKNCDLWQRMDRVLRFHRVECVRRRFDAPHNETPAPMGAAVKQQKSEKQEACGLRVGLNNWLNYRGAFLSGGRQRKFAALHNGWQRLTRALGKRMPRAWNRYLQGGTCANHRCVGEYSSTD